MVIDGTKLASMSDIGIMTVWATKDDMLYTTQVAKKYHCCSIFGLKCWAAFMKEQIRGSGVRREFSISLSGMNRGPFTPLTVMPVRRGKPVSAWLHPAPALPIP